MRFNQLLQQQKLNTKNTQILLSANSKNHFAISTYKDFLMAFCVNNA